MQRGMDKKGQEGVTLTTLLLIILGAVVVVVVILGFTKGFGFIFGKVDILPGQDLQAVEKSCEIAAGSNLKIDYCSFKEVKVEGVKELVNCDDLRVQSALDAASKGKISCDANAVADKCESLINALSGADGEKDCSKLIKVNGNVCYSIADEAIKRLCKAQ